MDNTYKVTTTKNFEVCISNQGDYGCFEHHIHGEEVGGGLWIEDGELIDYDGTFVLPLEVIEELISRGVKVDQVFYPDARPLKEKEVIISMSLDVRVNVPIEYNEQSLLDEWDFTDDGEIMLNNNFKSSEVQLIDGFVCDSREI